MRNKGFEFDGNWRRAEAVQSIVAGLQQQKRTFTVDLPAFVPEPPEEPYIEGYSESADIITGGRWSDMGEY